jgi:hypothetical protein
MKQHQPSLSCLTRLEKKEKKTRKKLFFLLPRLPSSSYIKPSAPSYNTKAHQNNTTYSSIFSLIDIVKTNPCLKRKIFFEVPVLSPSLFCNLVSSYRKWEGWE